MPKLKIVLSYVAAITIVTTFALGADFYVDAGAGSDSNGGSSPEDAWLTITQALSSVEGTSEDPVTIHVAAGTYSASTNGETFPLRMKSYVSLIGAGAESIMLDAEGAAYHVIYALLTQGTSLECLTIKGGNALGAINDRTGGGVLCGYLVDFIMRSCTVTENTAGMGGGLAMGNSSGLVENCAFLSNTAQGIPQTSEVGTAAGVLVFLSEVRFENCTISDNQALPGVGTSAFALGAGVSVMDFASRSFQETLAMLESGTATFVDCVFEDNSCSGDNGYGGGISCGAKFMLSEPVFTNCHISGNSACSGAGIFCETSAPKLENCTIVGNEAPLDSNEASWGGGIHILDSLASITRCIISDNSAYSGAGIWCEGTPSGTIAECTISDNVATANTHGDSYGGGIHCYESSPTISDCTISGNSASLGAGIRCSAGSSPEITNCNITDNDAPPNSEERSWGGGLSSNDSSPAIIDCSVLRNSSWAGAGIACENGNALTVIRNCRVSNNTATVNTSGQSYGGGIWCFSCSPSITNCLVHANSAALGGGIRASSSQSSFVGCTIVGNLADTGGSFYCTGQSLLLCSDSIIWGNHVGLYTDPMSSVNLTYSCIQDGYAGEGNISDDPLFMSGPLGDYYLSCRAAGQGANSPCIDAGSDTAEALGLDELTTRTDCGPDAGVADMGYHYPLTSGEGPVIECLLNADEFSTGDQLVGLYEINNPGAQVTVDVYFAFVMPDGAILCISSTRIDFGIFPCMTDVFLEQGYSMAPETLVDIAVPGGLPDGGYLFAGALSTPGEFAVIGDLSLFAFSMR